MSEAVGTLIDLDRYPIDAPDSARGRALVTRLGETLRDEGLCRLDGVRVVEFRPGTLMVFRGHYSLHRVSAVRSRHPPLISVMNYNAEPDWVGTPHINEVVYGLRQRA